MNPFNLAASTVATIKLVLLAAAVLGVTGYLGKLVYDSNKLERIEQQDKTTAKALKSMGQQAKKEAKREADYFAKNKARADKLTKDLQNENAKFDAAARAEYFSVLNDALRGAQ